MADAWTAASTTRNRMPGNDIDRSQPHPTLERGRWEGPFYGAFGPLARPLVWSGFEGAERFAGAEEASAARLRLVLLCPFGFLSSWACVPLGRSAGRFV